MGKGSRNRTRRPVRHPPAKTGPSDVASPKRRAAQQRIVGTVNVSAVLGGGGLALWRETDCGEWKATAAEIGDDLSALDVPHQIVTAFRPPRANSRTLRPRRGEEVRIATQDLAHLVRWMPSLQEHLDELPQDAPGFAFVYFEPRAEGMAMMTLSAFAAEWPSWTDKQAAAMGLTCDECGYDLRSRQEDRLPYNIPAPPQKRRLVCGRCCNDGTDEMERLAAAVNGQD